jgi:hypothetical protein
MSLFGDDRAAPQTNGKNGNMATVTQLQEATNAEGKPIILAVAYDEKVHGSVCMFT